MNDKSKEFLFKFSRKERKTAYESMLCMVTREVLAVYEKTSTDKLKELIENAPQEIREPQTELLEQIESMSEYISKGLGLENGKKEAGRKETTTKA